MRKIAQIVSKTSKTTWTEADIAHHTSVWKVSLGNYVNSVEALNMLAHVSPISN